MPRVYTVGHSNHQPDAFVELLLQHHIGLVIDVRAQPYSAYTTWFNQEALAGLLQRYGVAYRFEGAALGARPTDPACYAEGRVMYARVAAQPAFAAALNCAVADAGRTPTVLMCAEADPLSCHRSILLGQTLDASGVDLVHIRADGALESQEQLSQRLMRERNLDQPNLFESPELRRERAYREQEQEIAWRLNARRGTS